ncbi:ABC transporter substrate-binding protein [Thermanaerothrix daxensis]|uniref:ABC transporter substrate-binding protein n=1 Tax=Thermanaerothrix daxensis TaxID=869279 RepID=A0A0P6Y141_9CHLR|nr:ABC transporter substrate-binding protein [Thermanaerothrix daxensis]KPL82725.1 ABC transporter substrate-binding protein [Thermanaerothrix daxensis]
MKTLRMTMVLMAIVALILAACAPATPQVVKETVEVEKQVVVTQEVVKEVPAQRAVVRLSGWAASPEETALLQSLLLDFTAENPDIVVKYEPITGDFWATLKTSIAAGTEPDIYYMDIFQFPAFVQDDVMLPLDDLMATTGTKKEEFIPSLIDAFSANGKVYGIPKDFNTLGLFYNKDLFAQAGLAEPTDDWTWDDLKTAAEKLSNPANNIYGLGVPADAGRFPIFVFQNGGSIMTPDFQDTLLDSPEAIEAGKFYTSFRAEKIGAIPADVGEGWQGTVFGKGQFAMVYEGGWLIPYLKQQFPNINYGVVVPPAGPKGEGNLIFTVAYVISKNSKNPEAAWRVINYLTSEAAQRKVMESGFALPTRLSLQESDYLKTNPASAAIFRGALQGARPFMWGLVGSDVNDQMTKALERVYLENQSVEESFKQAAEAIRQKLAELK